MRRLFACVVILLALVATRLTLAEVSEQPAASVEAPPAPTAPPSAETPLHVRPTTALALQPSPSSSNIGWKLLAMAFVAGAGFWLWKRRAPHLASVSVPRLSILRRTSLGVRNELVLIELEGQRLLLGVTPHSIQNLYIVPDADDGEALLGDAPPSLAQRLAGVIDTVEDRVQDGTPAHAPAAAPKRPKRATKAATETGEAPIEGQARGLASLGERR